MAEMCRLCCKMSIACFIRFWFACLSSSLYLLSSLSSGYVVCTVYVVLPVVVSVKDGPRSNSSYFIYVAAIRRVNCNLWSETFALIIVSLHLTKDIVERDS